MKKIIKNKKTRSVVKIVLLVVHIALTIGALLVVFK